MLLLLLLLLLQSSQVDSSRKRKEGKGLRVCLCFVRFQRKGGDGGEMRRISAFFIFRLTLLTFDSCW